MVCGSAPILKLFVAVGRAGSAHMREPVENGHVVFRDIVVDTDETTVSMSGPCGKLDMMRIPPPSKSGMIVTKLATFADTSKSDERPSRVKSTVAKSEGVKRDMSRRHSVASVLRTDREIRSDLPYDRYSVINSEIRRYIFKLTHALEREFPPCAFRHSPLILFSSSLPNLWIFPGVLAA